MFVLVPILNSVIMSQTLIGKILIITDLNNFDCGFCRSIKKESIAIHCIDISLPCQIFLRYLCT